MTYNEEMLAAHPPLLLDRPGSAVEEHDGIAVKLAQALGAGVAYMDACEVALHMDPQYLIRGIMDNARGQRFINEDTYPGRIGQAALFQSRTTGRSSFSTRRVSRRPAGSPPRRTSSSCGRHGCARRRPN
ncbi:hypothetical protein [Streptomyces sp. NBC_01669]|uniref:hypothetical protein n=1 Tax=Streptomyces sp. NBC_01669 TaxID=2975909 RepID=UPI002254C6A3|nr:hypothetical protein [Streptomyces sp. NBC_01669]MCX4538087.1 hypothetical protein [Streptomyces sp. NBC_01669]